MTIDLCLMTYDLRPPTAICHSLPSRTAPTHLKGARPDLQRLRRQPAAHASIDSIIVFLIVVTVVIVVIVVFVVIDIIVVIVAIIAIVVLAVVS